MKSAIIALTLTAYAMDGQPGALGHPVRAHKTVAVSQDLRHLLGREVHIEGLGWRFVSDTMPPKWRGRIDVAVSDREQAREFGKQKGRILGVHP